MSAIYHQGSIAQAAADRPMTIQTMVTPVTYGRKPRFAGFSICGMPDRPVYRNQLQIIDVKGLVSPCPA
jgi:hypothetical protein